MKVKEFLSGPEVWTQGVIARDKNNKPVFINHPGAVKWCLVGAICKCYDCRNDKLIISLLYDKVGLVGNFNDTHTFEEVKALVEEMDI